MAQKIIIASGNQGKIKEFKHKLEPLHFNILSQKDLGLPTPAETGTTFIENALIKAKAACLNDHWTLADDSGLVVDALDGAPGIYSARYAGENVTDKANNQKLITALKNIPATQRTARFVCVLVLMKHIDDPLPLIVQGTWQGLILEEPQGDDGFGYDPLFWCPEHNCSAATLALAVKNNISHRAQAMQQLLNALNK